MYIKFILLIDYTVIRSWGLSPFCFWMDELSSYNFSYTKWFWHSVKWLPSYGAVYGAPLFQLFTVKWWDNWETKYYGDPIVCQCELAVPSKNDISFWPFAKSSCSICFCCSYELLDFRCTLNSMVKLLNMHSLFKISMLIK